jgi:Peptidase A4 family
VPKIPRSVLFVALISFLLVLPSIAVASVYADSSQIVNPPTVMKSPTWAGYDIEAPNAGITAVRASFKQPALNCNPAAAVDRHAAFIAGLNGQLTNAFEFVGTEGTCPSGSVTPTYSEIATAGMAPIIPIVVGHDYLAAIVESGGTYHYVLKDVTTGAISKGTGTGPSVVFAAECVVNRPLGLGGSPAPLANFGTVSFGQDFTKVRNTCFATYSGMTKAIWAFTVPQLALVKYVMYNVALTSIDANTSPITPDKSSFRVMWVNSGP